jgi:putative phage-type endonuclease
MPFDATFDRTKGIGASECGAAAGLNPYRSPAMVAAQKLGLIQDEPAGAAAEVGTELEPKVLELFARREGIDLASIRTPDKTITHPQYLWMFCTPDAIAPDYGIEIKVVGVHTAKHFGRGDRYGDNEVPPYYLAQMAWCCMITGLKLWRMAALVGTDLRTFTYQRSEKFEAALFDRCSTLWHGFIAKGQCPAPEWGRSDTDDLLRALYPADTLGVRPATADEVALLARLRELHDAKKAADAAYDAARQQVMDAIGEHSGLASDIANPTWKKDADSVRVDYKAALLEFQPLLGKRRARQLEKLIGKHTTTKPGARKFLPRFSRDDE